MKKVLTFFAYLVIAASMLGALFVGAAIYDVAEKTTVESFFFQPTNDSSRRLPEPESAKSIGAEALRNKLIQKFVTEYFYVLPNYQNIEARKDGSQSGLRLMSSADVFDKWVKNVVPEISEMSKNKVLRTVYVNPETITQNQGSKRYLRVPFTLTTWEHANDFSVAPTITNGIMYMEIRYAYKVYEMIKGKSLQDYLETGGDPASIFDFRVRDVVIEWANTND